MEDLLKSTPTQDSNDGGPVWTIRANIPIGYSRLVSMRSCLLAIGGMRLNNVSFSGAVHCYDVATNSWSVVGGMPTPRCGVLAAVLPSNELVVVGGEAESGYLQTTVQFQGTSTV